MSARLLRRTFATPFVLTLAAIPACTVTSSPGPAPVRQQEARNDEAHDHRDEPKHVNPPGPTTPPPVQQQPAGTPPTMTPVANPPRPVTPPPANTGTNSQVKGTANTGADTVVQSKPDPGPEPGRGYRQWTITRSGTKCQALVKVSCPPNAMCNPPPPSKYTCPKDLEDNGRMNIIQNAAKGDCFVDFGEFKCPPTASCNPPRPQKVACPK